jgi:Uma2 family endonuclease
MATAARSPDDRLMTAEEMLALPDEVRAELVDGVLVMVPPAGGEHGWINIRLIGMLYPWVTERGLGELFDSSTAFILRRSPDLVRAPDVAFVSAARVPRPIPKGGLELAPDLAVEVLSPSNTAGEINRKLGDYFGHGTSAVWIVDPEHRTVTVYAPPAAPRLLREDETLDGGEVLPGFETPVAALFAGLGPG